MELRLGTTREDELQRLAVLQGTLHDQVTSDRVVLETLEHLTAKQLEIKGAAISAEII
jgi:hypothetical protein